MTWKRRARTLKQLGFASYSAYLSSPLWRSIRKRVFSPICQSCLGEATLVHHTSYGYKTLKGICLKNLVSLCADCHEQIHEEKRFSVMVQLTYRMCGPPIGRTEAHKPKKAKSKKPKSNPKARNNKCSSLGCNRPPKKGLVYCEKCSKPIKRKTRPSNFDAMCLLRGKTS